MMGTDTGSVLLQIGFCTACRQGRSSSVGIGGADDGTDQTVHIDAGDRAPVASRWQQRSAMKLPSGP